MNNIKISDIISKYTKLEPYKGEWRGLCPFHNEKTPSFYVNDEKGVYYCFGCKAHGGIVNFLMQKNKCNYSEAKVELEKMFKINFSNFDKENGNIFKLYNDFSHLTHNILLNHKNKETLFKDRKISLESIKKFRLGLVYNNVFLNYQKEEKIQSGIFNDKNELKFKNKIVIPIVNENNHIISFAFRSIDNSEPKYINIQNNKYFKKKEILFGINLAREEIMKKDAVYIVEGYFDCIAMHSIGITNTVALAGCELYDEQLFFLKRYTNNFIFFFDGDEAGLKGIEKGIIKCLQNSIKPSVAFCKKGTDPDNLFKLGILEKYAKKIYNWYDYFILKIKSIKESVEQLQEIERIKKIFSGCNILILNELKKKILENFGVTLNLNNNNFNFTPVKKDLEDYIILFIVNDLSVLNKIDISSAFFEKDINSKRFEYILENKDNINISELIYNDLFTDISFDLCDNKYSNNAYENIQFLLKKIRLNGLYKRRDNLLKEIDNNKNLDEIKELSIELKSVLLEIQDVLEKIRNN